MSQHFRDLKKPFSFVASFFLKLSQSICFKVRVLDQPGWKLKTKLTNGRAKISNHDEVQRLVLALEDRKNLDTINLEVCLHSIRSICRLVVLDDFISNGEGDLLDSQPFFLEGNSLLKNFALLQLLVLHLIQGNNYQNEIKSSELEMIYSGGAHQIIFISKSFPLRKDNFETMGCKLQVLCISFVKMAALSKASIFCLLL